MRVGFQRCRSVSSGDEMCGSDLNASTSCEHHPSMPYELSTASCVIRCLPKTLCRRLRGANVFMGIGVLSVLGTPDR